MPSYFTDLVLNVTYYADILAAAPALAEDKLAREGTGCLVVQAAKEAQGDA